MQDNNIDNGITDVNVNNDIYKCWSVEHIRPYIIKFLEEKIHNSLITFETNFIDIVVFDFDSDDEIPVEIQKTIIASNGKYFLHSQFEGDVRKQIEDNIENYRNCWLFFDFEYLRYLQSGNVGKNISINMNWLVEYLKKGKIKVFVIRYDGTIKELSIIDFDFLKDISQTDSLGYDNDDRILNRNKLKIFKNLLKGYGFSQKEIYNFYNDFKNRDKSDRKDKFSHLLRFLQVKGSDRGKLYGHILHSISELGRINKILDMNCDNVDSSSKMNAKYLGIFETEGSTYKAITRFIDRFDVCKYFPGYLRNKDMWDKLKCHNLNIRQFENIVMKKIDINKGIDYFWYEM